MFDYLVGTALLRALFGPDFHTETFQRRLGLICFVLLALLVTGVGWFRSHWLAADLSALAADGATAEGAIVDKKDGWNRNSYYYDFVIEYTAPDQTRHHKTISTDATEYNAKRIGSPMEVHYVRSKPDTFYLVGQEPKEAEITLMRYFLYGGLASLAVTSAALVMMWSGGGGGDRGRRPNLPAAPPPRPAALGPDGRPVFGKRG